MAFCGEIRYAIIRKRDEWRANMVNSCVSWADEGSEQCSQYADQGYNQCASQYLNECHWYSPWNCIAGWLCDAWYWVSNIVCVAWYWLANMVCRAFAWIIYWVLTIVADLIWLVLYIPCRLFGGPFGPTGKIKHIFVLVLENRSFDHMLGVSTGQLDGQGGWSCGVGVGTNGQPTTVDGPSPAFSNSHAGVSYPARAGAPYLMPIDPPHEFCDVQMQLASTSVSGAPTDDHCDYSGTYPPIYLQGFVDNYANQASYETDATAQAAARADLGAVMASLTPAQVPAISKLARSFAICDHWFSALPGPTWPNRFFLQAATSGGLDRSPTTPEIIASELDGYEFENGTIYDALDGKDLEWRVYHGDDFPVVGALAGMDLATMATNFHGLDDFASDLKDDSFDSAYVFIEPNYGHVLTHGSNFQCGNSQHPIDDVTRGDALIKYVYDAIRQSPHWESSMLVVLYDEHGGFYDHVLPPTAVPPGDVTDPANNGHGFRFDRQGVRVPAIVASPFIPSMQTNLANGQNCNLIDHTPYDHGSLLATIENIYGLSPLTQRDARATNFSSLLSLANPRTDAPIALDAAADSGWSCGEAPVPSAAANPPPAGSAGAQSEDTTKPITATLRGFVELAAIADARLHPAEKKRIRMRLMTLRTVGDAREYLAEIAPQLRAQKATLAATGMSTARTRVQRVQRRATLRERSRPR
jgi:phospholipase C